MIFRSQISRWVTPCLANLLCALLFVFGLNACDVTKGIDEKQEIIKLKRGVSDIIQKHAQGIKETQTYRGSKQQQEETLAAFRQLFDKFKGEPDKEQLNAVVALYDFAYAVLLQHNIDLLKKMSLTLDPDRYQKVKMAEQYKLYLSHSESLLAAIESFKKTLPQHIEEVRLRVYRSELDTPVKGRLWTEIEESTNLYFSRERDQLSLLKSFIIEDRKVMAFLAQHKEQFIFDERNQIQFKQPSLRSQFRNLWVDLESIAANFERLYQY